MTPDLRALPGGDLVMEGIHDLRAGADTAAAMLVEIGRPRLRAAGLEIPESGESRPEAELRLYARLVADGIADPYAAYNALLRRMASCAAALELSLGITLRAREKHAADSVRARV